MENNNKQNGRQTFAIWFGLAALMFGTQVGGSMAAGTYAVGYFAPFGGGWLLAFTAIYFCFRSAFAIHALEFTRLFKTDNYSAYYLELYGLNRDDANPILKKAHDESLHRCYNIPAIPHCNNTKEHNIYEKPTNR